MKGWELTLAALSLTIKRFSNGGWAMQAQSKQADFTQFFLKQGLRGYDRGGSASS